ncbi:MAG: hypothetical protein BWX71_01986 [Deltaproteobacteria bacterium ADurb.Bin072]|nr:MAG: hypothetical protein BWX71_01986 [Deltaproteobacteria bacterium ADurb.Bin072]
MERLSHGFHHGPAHLEVDLGEGPGEEGAVPRLVAGQGGQHVVGQGCGLGHGELAGHQQIEPPEGLLVGRGVRKGPQGVGLAAHHDPGPVRVLAQDLLGQHVGREHTHESRKVRGHGAPGLGIPLVRVGAERHEVAGYHVAAPRAEPSAHGGQEEVQVGCNGAVAVHVDAQVRVHAPLPGGQQPAHLANLLVVESADRAGCPGIEAPEPGGDLFEPRRVLFDVVHVLPSLGQDDGDHCPGEQGIGAGADGQVDVGDLGGL